MAIDFNNLSKRIYGILKSRGNKIKMFKENGEPALDIEKEARKFFIENDAIMVSVDQNGEESQINVYISGNTDLDELIPLLNNIRKTATVFSVNYNLKKYNKTLKPKDFAFMAHKAAEEEKINESPRVYGSTKSSYQTYGGPARLIVRHSKSVDENKRGARSRNIKALFVETHEGERLKFPTNWVTGARAMTRHISEGGKWDDDMGNHIKMEAAKFTKLKEFIKHNRNTINEDGTKLIEKAKSVKFSITKNMNKLAGNKSYHNAAENILKQPSKDIVVNEDEVAKYREIFNISEDDNFNEIMEILGTMNERINISSLKFRPSKRTTPSFNNNKDKMAYHLSDFAARVMDDAASNYLSKLADKFRHNEKITDDERKDIEDVIKRSKEHSESSLNYVTESLYSLIETFGESNYRPDTDPYGNGPSDASMDAAYTNAVDNAEMFIDDKMSAYFSDVAFDQEFEGEQDISDFLNDVKGDVYRLMQSEDEILSDEDIDNAFDEALRNSKFWGILSSKSNIDTDKLIKDMSKDNDIKDDMQSDPKAVIDQYKS